MDVEGPNSNIYISRVTLQQLESQSPVLHEGTGHCLRELCTTFVTLLFEKDKNKMKRFS